MKVNIIASGLTHVLLRVQEPSFDGELVITAVGIIAVLVITALCIAASRRRE